MLKDKVMSKISVQIMLLLIFFISLPSSETFCAEPKHIELSSILLDFMLDKNDSRKMPFWDFNSENTKIEWITNGVDALGESSQIRVALAFIQVKEKGFYVLEKRKKYLPWRIAITGDKFGVKLADFSPPNEVFGNANSGGDFDIEQAVEDSPIVITKVCELAEYSERAVGYRMTADGKQDATLVYVQTCGSGGCTNSITVHYAKYGHESMQKLLGIHSGYLKDKHKF